MEPLNAEDPVSVGPFRLLGRLGAGGMGRVFLARSAGGRTVAVKVVHAELAAREEFRRRFAREVAALERVGGTGTAPVLGADTTAEAPWVAVGYVAGPSLRTVVAEEYGPLPPATVRALAGGLARALVHIHDAGLVHRDLKPSNVLLTVDGPRIIDFGIARAVDTVTDGGLTTTGALVGSPGFMSPEQVRGERLTPASDLFCLGSVLAYAATGRGPFGTADSGVHATLFRIAHDEPDLADLAPELTGLIRACLAKEPGARPTAAEIAATLPVPDPWLPAGVLARLGRHAALLLEAEAGTGDPAAGDPTPATPPPRATAPEPPRGRGRTALAAGLAALAVAVTATAAYTLWPEGGPSGAGSSDGKPRAGSGGTAGGSARPAGIVPAGFLGAWEGVLQGDADNPRETTRIEIGQGAAGSKAAVYTHVTPERFCMGRARLAQADEDRLVLGDADVTASIPAQRCTPAAGQTLALVSPNVLTWTSGTAKATFRKVPAGPEVVPAAYLGSWRTEANTDVYGPQAERWSQELTVTQGPVGAPLVRHHTSSPRLSEDGTVTADVVNCTATAVLAGAGTTLVLSPQTRVPQAWDLECGEQESNFLVADRHQGRDRLLLYPMADSEPAEFFRD
ncbi:serine/threonine-protein kinase [Streptomyces sp. NPDC126503]|uniref:serine/threonine-protein kinase n=1 Tax=Streptomyces sp. NPDC126503 TaxID=3155315 RepID=UPI0033336509